ncbi:unnamed protein product [Cyprideis torosa]|uniref:UBX domain-containing protein 4 n=1 Tax=Cyprideis torosa TaxID=163714 RepID=A0A7R8W3J6_9CRUS|nr:unnamed protein product [Cyprideis torosa]CAG0883086.1 unnamed protein product [Cyprideis torosa]
MCNQGSRSEQRKQRGETRIVRFPQALLFLRGVFLGGMFLGGMFLRGVFLSGVFLRGYLREVLLALWEDIPLPLHIDSLIYNGVVESLPLSAPPSEEAFLGLSLLREATPVPTPSASSTPGEDGLSQPANGGVINPGLNAFITESSTGLSTPLSAPAEADQDGLELGLGPPEAKRSRLERTDAVWSEPSTPLDSRESSPSRDSTGSSSRTPGGGQVRGRGRDKYRDPTSSYDIDNIVIPHSIAASVRVPERLPYKEIPTPGWRCRQLSPVVRTSDAVEDAECDEEEDISDEAIERRHAASEVEERKRYLGLGSTGGQGGSGQRRGAALLQLPPSSRPRSSSNPLCQTPPTTPTTPGDEGPRGSKQVVKMWPVRDLTGYCSSIPPYPQRTFPLRNAMEKAALFPHPVSVSDKDFEASDKRITRNSSKIHENPYYDERRGLPLLAPGSGGSFDSDGGSTPQEGKSPMPQPFSRTSAMELPMWLGKDDEGSKQMLGILEREGIVDVFPSSSFTMVRLEQGTPEYSQFNSLYPVMVVPCIYFIGSSGMLLHAVGGVVSEDVLRTHAQKAEEMRANEQKKTSAVHIPLNQPSSSTAVEPQAPEGSSQQASDKQESAQSLEERVRLAKELVAKKRMEKEREAAEKEKLSEVDRRETGKAMLKQKEKLEEEARLREVEERKKDRERDRLARERVLEQIRQDREEKAARHSASLLREREEADERRKRALEEERRRLEEETIARSTVARIQFRLPDGSSQVANFSPDDPFNVVIQYARDHLDVGNRRNNFRLASTYPRRNFDPQVDGPSTLRQLSLIPNATLIVFLGIPQSAPSEGGSLISSALSAPLTIIFTLLSPFFTILNWLRSMVGLGSTPSTVASRKKDDGDPSTSATPETTRGGQPEGSTGERDQSTGSSAGGGGAVNRRPQFKQEGNIRRFANVSDEDEEEGNTWNGNSTQQQPR